MKENIIADKTFDFAVRIVNLHKYLISNGNNIIQNGKTVQSPNSDWSFEINNDIMLNIRGENWTI